MGNIISFNKNKPDPESNAVEKNNIYEVVNYIATHYILTMNFETLTKLSDKTYCDKLIILTSKIFEDKFNEMDIEFLAKKTGLDSNNKRVEVNTLKSDKLKYITKEQLEYIRNSTDHIDNVNGDNNNEQIKFINSRTNLESELKTLHKKRMCIGIAKFYIKIAHIFAAIVKTINPIYSYKNETGKTVQTEFLKKHTIPKNTKRQIRLFNICDSRLKILKEGFKENGNRIEIHPNVCNNNDSNDNNENNLRQRLSDEPGIAEIIRLYNDDNYDYSTGEFTGMNPETTKQYNIDLKSFYIAFTGETDMPLNIKSFDDIELKDYKSDVVLCSDNIKGIMGDRKNDMFIEYANNIKSMMSNATSNQLKLLEIINDIFIIELDEKTKQKNIRIKPTLNDKLLEPIIEKTRMYIIDLYTQCEKDYANGIKIYKSIIESKQIQSLHTQTIKLEEDKKRLINEYVKSI